MLTATELYPVTLGLNIVLWIEALVYGHKMHAGICLLLGFVALNGIMEGVVTRFELELIFLSFAILMPAVWSSLMPGRLGLITLISKPEFWLQLVMFAFYSELVRVQILIVCIVFNCWGILVYLRVTRTQLLETFSYATLRAHCVDAIGEEAVTRFDKISGYAAPPQAEAADPRSL